MIFCSPVPDGLFSATMLPEPLKCFCYIYINRKNSGAKGVLPERIAAVTSFQQKNTNGKFHCNAKKNTRDFSVRCYISKVAANF